jgi:thiamine biosynthesis lipoprotein
VFAAASFHRLLWAELPGPVFEFRGETMGTTYVVKVVASSMPRRTRDSLATAIQSRLERVNALMSTWRPDSELSRFNRHASTEPFRASPETVRVFAAARDVSARSRGAFDVTVRPLVQAWGFGDGARVPGGPSPEELALLRARVGWRGVQVDEDDQRLVKHRPDIECDLSAIAKGFGADSVSDGVASLGFRDHLVEVGGELRARGRREDGAAWTVAIERPDTSNARAVFETVPLLEGGMATSGDYRNYYEQDGVRTSHTIDPRDGRPISHALASVTVIDSDAMRADAWATALDVLGPEEGFALAEEQGLAAYFIVREKDGTFRTRQTRAFRELERVGSPVEPARQAEDAARADGP